MDYDENDFQSQTFQLIGEESKISVNLRSFALPKFDLDEHLKFGCLIETGVLLGIEDQENNWIDFPSGSTAVEFSSSAAESCSISRHNNVWSEATSSESVDLLLKSVGEDEINTGKAVVMESSANYGSDGLDNRADHCVTKDDALLINQEVIIKDECLKKLSNPSESLRNLLTHLPGSSQISEVEADGNITGNQYLEDENPTSSNEAIEKSEVAETVLCETVLKGGNVFDSLMRTNASNIDDCNSCVVVSHSPLTITCRNNQDERLVMDTTGFPNEQNHSVRIMSDLLYDNYHKEKSMAIHNVETNNQLVPKSDPLEVLKNCNDSVISEDFDGFVSVSCRTEPLIRDGETVDRFFGKDGACQLAKEQGKKNEDKSGDINNKAILKASLFSEGYQTGSGKLPDDYVVDDDHVYSTRNQSSTMSCNGRGKLVTCLDAFSNKQYPGGQMAENNSTDAYDFKFLTGSKASIQVKETCDHDSMSTNPPSITCEKNVYVAEGSTAEDMDVDRQEMKLDADKDVAPNESSLLSVVFEAEAKFLPSTSCKEAKSVVDMAEVPMEQVDVLVDKKSSVTCTNFGRVSLGVVSNIIERVQDSSPADSQTAEELPLDDSSVPLPLDFEKAMLHHQPPPKDNTDIDVFVEKKELLIQAPSTSNIIHSIDKDGKLFRGPTSSLLIVDLVSKKASNPVSVSYPINMEDPSPGKLPQDDSVAAKLDFRIKSTTSQLPEGIASFNVVLAKKEEPSSSSAMPHLFVPEENEVNLSGSSKLTSSSNCVDKETVVNGADAGSDRVEDVVNISTKNEAIAMAQHPSPVKSVDVIPVQGEVPSSSVDAVVNGDSVHLEGADLEGTACHGSGEGIDFSLVRNETSVFPTQDSCSDRKQAVHFPLSIRDNCSCKSPSNEEIDQCNVAARDISEEQNMSAQTEDKVLTRRTNDYSQIYTENTVKSNPSEEQSANPCSSDSCRQCPQDNLEHSEVKVSQSESNLAASGEKALVSSTQAETIQKLECSSSDLKTNDTSVEVGSFTFEASTSRNLPERGVILTSFPSSQPSDIQMLKENPQGCLDEVKASDIPAKTPNKGKTKNAYRLYNEKKTSSKRKMKKEALALKKSSEMDAKYSSDQLKYAGTSSKDSPLVNLRENSSVECCTMKSSSSPVGQASSIPDLNSSSSTSFQQSFTDLQQVQLRAQIFVYGALISGIPPDEAYMLSAFGDADGGRRLWEGVWRALIAKFQNKKSPVSGFETPSQSRSVGTNIQSKVPGSSTTKGSCKIVTSSVVNSTVPFPSPLWNLSYGNGHPASVPRGACLNSNHTASPLTPWRPSQLRPHVDASSPWFSQASHPATWFVSSHDAPLDGIKHYSTVSFSETMHATCASGLCGPHIPSVQVALPSVLTSVTDPTSTTTEAVIQLEATKKRGTIGSNKHTSKSEKARKMKGSAAEELNLHISQTKVESIPVISGVESLPLTSSSTLLSSNSPVKVAGGTVPISMSHIISPTHYQILGENNKHKANLSEETCGKIELAKLHAEDAAAVAASSIKHCQAIWSQLAAQKNSGLVSQIEEKLASAAVAAAAAAAVAKAAAAAAKVASDVAWQAKIMSDEAISAAKTGNIVRSPESGILDVGKKLAGLTPISILKGMDKIHESAEVLSAAREAAKRRIESASAATKQAENLDAIMKAAELAAEAVAQAGTIIAMGDPLPFTLGELVDAGTEFWKVHHGASMKDSKLSNIHGHEHVDLGNVKESAKQFDGSFSKIVQSQNVVSEGGSSSLTKCYEELDGTGTAQGNFPAAGHEREHAVCYSGIQKGSLVEVMSDDYGLRGAWFSARVLDMKDNKAYICYNDYLANEGHPKEWIALENEKEKAPRIRAVHFATAMKYEGTRKRRREHLGSYIWAPGDHVDTWIHDRWWEGTVVEKSSGDDTKLTVYLLAKGDKLVVDAWSVRPSLIWEDGQWMEWHHSREKLSKPHEGDTPQEKRQRLGGLEAMTHSEVDTAGMGKLSKNKLIDVCRKPEDSRSLILSVKERTFSVGKNSREATTSNALITKRSGLQKEGSKVVFGVPRPGKKRKFMEVSKHYVADKCENVRESSDPIKFAKYLMPQASQKFKNASKVDNKGKKPGDSRSRVGVKAGNSQCIQAKSEAQKDDVLLAASNGERRHENPEKPVNNLDKMNTFKFGSSRPAETPAVEPAHSVQPAPTALLSRKKNVPGSESDVAVKAKSNLNRASKGDDKGLGNHGKAILEVMEPRRSNRRIQPTSRLLEGIQSSLMVSKMPSISHEKKSSRGGSAQG